MAEAPHQPLSRALQETISDLRSRFTPYARSVETMFQRKSELAKPFMQGFARWKRETGRSFISFVQQVDPTVPAEKAAYQKHHSYQAALHLRRVDEAPHTVTGKKERRTKTPFDMLAVVMKSVLPLVRPHEAAMWATFEHASHWQQRDIEKLQARVRQVRPMPLRPDVPRLVYEGRRQVRKFTTEPLAAAGGER